MKKRASGFTLIELMVVLVIIGILVSLGIARYNSLRTKSMESQTKGNLGAIRSALSIYYGDNDQSLPEDDLSCLTLDNKYLQAPAPLARMPPYHSDTILVTPEVDPTDVGTWSYNNDRNNLSWGTVRVGCTHQDTKGVIWTTY